MNRPAWIAWDDLTARGECIRCGVALFANDDERPDAALARHVHDHETCAPDQAEKIRAQQEHNDIRTRLERLRLVDSGRGVALRSGDDPAFLASLLTDERVVRSADPVVRSALGRALIALSEVRSHLRIEPRRAPFHVAVIGAGIEDPSYESLAGFRERMKRAKNDPLSPATREAYDEYCKSDRPLPIDPRTGDISQYRQALEEMEILRRRQDRAIELENEKFKFEMKRAVADKFLELMPNLPMLGAALPSLPKQPRIVIGSNTGMVNQTTHFSARETVTRLSFGRSEDGIRRVVDIAVRGLTTESVKIVYNDMTFYEGSYSTLVKHCESIGLDLRKRVRIVQGIPWTITVRHPEGYASPNPYHGEIEIVLERVAVEKPKCACGNERDDGRWACAECIRRDQDAVDHAWRVERARQAEAKAARIRAEIGSLPVATLDTYRGNLPPRSTPSACLGNPDAPPFLPVFGCFCDRCETLRVAGPGRPL